MRLYDHRPIKIMWIEAKPLHNKKAAVKSLALKMSWIWWGKLECQQKYLFKYDQEEEFINLLLWNCNEMLVGEHMKAELFYY